MLPKICDFDEFGYPFFICFPARPPPFSFSFFWVVWALINFEHLLVFQVAEIHFDDSSCRSGRTTSLFCVSEAYV